MKEKKQELELSVLRADNNPKLNWVHKILDRATTDKITLEAQQSIEDDDNQMSWIVIDKVLLLYLCVF